MKTILHWSFWLLAILVLFLTVKKAYGEPIGVAENGGVRIVLHTEPCAIKGITNLPRRATFHEAGKTFEGCAGLQRELEMFVFYFEDQTVVVVPSAFFKRVIGA